MENKYKLLFNFLDSWFPDNDFEGKTEADIVNEFKGTVTSDELKRIIFEAEAVKSQINKYWVEVSKETNIYFSNEHEAETWLTKLIELLKQS